MKTTMHNILVCSAGRRVSLVEYFKHEARKLLGDNARVFTSDLAPELSPACIKADGSLRIGKFSDPAYIPTLLDFCREQRVGLVVPTIDTELLLLAENRDEFLEAGIQLVISEIEFVRICRDKRLTNAFFDENEFHIPRSVDIAAPEFPLFIKPINGSSSNEIHVIPDHDHLAPYLRDSSRFMHLEYLPPQEYEEYTVDMYFDRTHRLRCAVPRLRMAVRGGEIAKGVTVKTKVLPQVVERLDHIAGARGCITLQVFLKLASNELFGIEINPRFGGGYPLSYLAGANYPKMLIEEYLLGKEISSFDDWEDNLLLLRHDAELIVHDTTQ